MNKVIMFRYSLLTLVLVGVFVVHGAAQDAPAAGGYAKASISSKAVKNAAAFAVRTHGKEEGKPITLVKINKAEKQVVSGMNYRLCMTVRHGKKGEAHDVIAVVYQPIRKPMELTSFEHGDCSH
jgi:hypothetical protein